MRGSGVLAGLLERERQGLKVRANVHPSRFSSAFTPTSSGCGSYPTSLESQDNPPLALAFNNGRSGRQILAVGDEQGKCTLLDTSRNSTLYEGPWYIVRVHLHQNAIFDLAWSEDDSRLCVASGDQQISVVDTEREALLVRLKGHEGSVKTVSGCPGQNDCLASGSRDGRILVWDLRDTRSSPVAVISAPPLRRPRKLKGIVQLDNRQSVTAVMHLLDGRTLASAGSADGVVKFWDLRNTAAPVAATPDLASTRGITSLSQDQSGGSISVSCTNSQIHLIRTLSPEGGAYRTFGENGASSFYFKARLSPDGSQILSGTASNGPCVWQVAGGSREPLNLGGHEGEVSAVDWCRVDLCKIATCADDCTVLVWSCDRSRPMKMRRGVADCDLRPMLVGFRVPSRTSLADGLGEREGGGNTSDRIGRNGRNVRDNVGCGGGVEAKEVLIGSDPAGKGTRRQMAVSSWLQRIKPRCPPSPPSSFSAGRQGEGKHVFGGCPGSKRIYSRQDGGGGELGKAGVCDVPSDDSCEGLRGDDVTADVVLQERNGELARGESRQGGGVEKEVAVEALVLNGIGGSKRRRTIADFFGGHVVKENVTPSSE